MTISIIVAVSENNVIGVNNDLPWRLSNDLKFFKQKTTGHSILMGRNTFDSIGKALPNRENIIITRNKNFEKENCIIKNSIKEAISYCREKNEDEIFIIGGDTIYKQSLNLANKIYLTRVHTEIKNGTAFFPILEKGNWEKQDEVIHFKKDEKNEYDHSFETYFRIL
ncbi:MAG: dihydrofolate reductase [Chitinophagaceae bacterium]|nr:dihydrofolate reductase [Chitinophagaceae bacterium]